MFYAVNCTFNETIMVEAIDKNEAEYLALARMEEGGYGPALGQVEVNSIEEVK